MKKHTWKFATEFTATFVTWQFIVTMDGIRNSCDVGKTTPAPFLSSKYRNRIWNFGLHQNRFMAPSESYTANPFAQKYHLLRTKFVFIIENRLLPKINSYSPRLLYFNCFTDPNCIASHLGSPPPPLLFFICLIVCRRSVNRWSSVSMIICIFCNFLHFSIFLYF